MADERISRKYLRIYLRDHLAAAVAGSELARRMHNAERHNALGEQVEVLLEAIEEDRETLEQLMDRLDISGSSLKKSAAWLGEKLGRLKTNGQLVRRSPLSPVLELEGLATGIAGKRSLWESLQASPVAERFPEFDFDRLIERADDQLDLVRELHRLVAEETFSASARKAGPAASST